MTVRWRARWTMSSTQAVPRRLEAALSPAVGPMMWMQVGRQRSSGPILLVFGRRSISIQTLHFKTSFIWGKEWWWRHWFLDRWTEMLWVILFLSDWIEMVPKPRFPSPPYSSPFPLLPQRHPITIAISENPSSFLSHFQPRAHPPTPPPPRSCTRQACLRAASLPHSQVWAGNYTAC